MSNDGREDQREPGERFCFDCPDHEGCMSGMPCDVVKGSYEEPAEEPVVPIIAILLAAAGAAPRKRR